MACCISSVWHALVLCVVIGLCVVSCFISVLYVLWLALFRRCRRRRYIYTSPGNILKKKITPGNTSRLSPEAFATARHVLTCNDSNGKAVTGHDGQLTEVRFSLGSGAASLTKASKASFWYATAAGTPESIPRSGQQSELN